MSCVLLLGFENKLDAFLFVRRELFAKISQFSDVNSTVEINYILYYIYAEIGQKVRCNSTPFFGVWGHRRIPSGLALPALL